MWNIIDMTESASDEDTKKDEIIFELVKKSYDEIFDTKKVLDDKGGNLIGYTTIVTGLLVGLGAFNISDKLSLPQYYLPYFVGIGLLLGTIVFSMLSVRVKGYSSVPTTSDLRKALEDDRWKYRTVIRQYNVAAMEAIETNYIMNQRKALWIRFSWSCLVGGLIAITIYVSIVAVW
jgi:hypothetical protein